LRYPVAFIDYVDRFSRRWKVSPALVLSIIREESAFDRNALSNVGAGGLMQLMPETAKWIFSKLRYKEIGYSAVFNSRLNIEAGTWYLSRLINMSGGSYLAAIASYNAGSSRMRKWRKQFHPEMYPLISLELIGPSETRTFTRRVLNSFAVYSSLGTYRVIGDK